jgi:hypothetical protein
MSELNFVCPPAPLDKRKYISDLGKILLKDYGKKKYYKPSEVKKAHKKSEWSTSDFDCWGMSTYSSHFDFDKYHQETGETCDYATMKSEMLEGISSTDSVHLTEMTNVDLDSSWLDIGDLLGGILEGIGEFFSAILNSDID